MSIGCFGKSLSCNTEYKDAWGRVRTKRYRDDYGEAFRRATGSQDYLPGEVRTYSPKEIEAMNRALQGT
jgi:hypothetical protein